MAKRVQDKPHTASCSEVSADTSISVDFSQKHKACLFVDRGGQLAKLAGSRQLRVVSNSAANSFDEGWHRNIAVELARPSACA